jgi:hypothetical protein
LEGKVKKREGNVRMKRYRKKFSGPEEEEGNNKKRNRERKGNQTFGKRKEGREYPRRAAHRGNKSDPRPPPSHTPAHQREN